MPKRKYKQLFSTNCDKILHDIQKPPKGIVVVDPFSGNGELVNWLGRRVVEYDVEPRRSTATRRDSFRNPPPYANKFVLTNPPVLARNKSKDKSLFELFGQNNLYKIFLVQLCNDPPIGGILILPVGFWSSSNRHDIELRSTFLTTFCVSRVNIYEEALFEDGALSAVAFFYSRPVSLINFSFLPNGGEQGFILDESTNWTIGWDVIRLSTLRFKHAVTRVIQGGPAPNTHLKLKTLDEITMECSDVTYYGKKTSRTFASIRIVPAIDQDRQKLLIKQFNEFVSRQTDKYRNMWLSNYSAGARKRIGFELAYSIIAHLLE